MQLADPANRSRLAPFVAAGLGFLAFLFFFDWRLLDPTHIGWVSGADRATNFLGWHFFRHEPWTWPPGLVRNYASGIGGASVAITDSLPLLAFLLKPFDAWLAPDFNYLGLWIAVSYVLQGWFSYRLLAAMGVTVGRALAGALLMCLMPFMAARATWHVPLVSHWLCTAALWLYLEAARDPRRFIRWSVLLPVAAMIQPYIFLTISPVFAASFVAIAWTGPREGRARLAAQAALAVALSAFVLYLLGFTTVSVSNTWGWYGSLSMNLLAWFNSMNVGVLLPQLPVAEFNQTEAYMYLGVGGILVLAAGVALIAWKRPRLARVHWPLVVAAAALFAFAVTHRVGLGPWFLVDPGPLPPFLHFLDPFRSSGRFAWLTTYLVMATTIAACARFAPRAFVLLLAAAIPLNLADGRKIRGTGHHMLEAGLHREPVNCAALPASVKRVVFLPQVVLEDLSIAQAWEVAVCAGRQGQPMNSGALARTNMDRLQEGAREAASFLDRGPEPGVAYVYANPATGLRLGAGPSPPKMGGYHVFLGGQASGTPAAAAVDPAWDWPLSVEMNVFTENRVRHVLLYGWTVPLGDVRSYSREAALLLPVPPGLAAPARLHLFASPAPGDRGDIPADVRANGTPVGRLVLSGARGPAWYTVRIPAAVIAAARGALAVELSTPELRPTVPRRAHPEERQRVAIVRLLLRTDLPGVVSGRVKGGSADNVVLGQGWSGAETWGVWSNAKVATIKLPLTEPRPARWKLRFFGHAHSRDGPQEADVIVGGRTVARWSWASLAADEWREAEIPASLVPADAHEVEITFAIARPAPPGPGDSRDLGIAIVSYELLAQ